MVAQRLGMCAQFSVDSLWIVKNRSNLLNRPQSFAAQGPRPSVQAVPDLARSVTMSDARSKKHVPRRRSVAAVGRAGRLIDVDAVRDLLRREVEREGGQSAWARRSGVDRPHLSRVLNGQAMPGPTLIEALGLEKVVAYRRRP
jgi:hypothetical protein